MDKLNQWLAVLANIGVVVGIIFLALEIRTNTATNRIAIQSSFSANWVDINGGIAHDRELAMIIEKARAGDELDDVEHRQFHHYVRQLSSQGALMRRLYREGLATADDVANAHQALRQYSQYKGFQDEIAELGDNAQCLILDPECTEGWLANPFE
jgi:Zn-dependent M32 family carboxypeptidase